MALANAKITSIESSLDLENAEKVVQGFKSLYSSLNASNCRTGIIEDVYADAMRFEDSFHEIEGVEAFVDYCDSLYENVKQISFDFHDEWLKPDGAVMTWTMTYVHPRINKGQTISVEGSSVIKFNEKVLYHRDYFDGGQLLYEHVPVLGTVIQQLKKRMK